MTAIRVMAEDGPTLIRHLGLVDAETLTKVIQVDGETFYRAETHDHYVLYKKALSGWGGTDNGQGGQFVPDTRQR